MKQGGWSMLIDDQGRERYFWCAIDGEEDARSWISALVPGCTITSMNRLLPDVVEWLGITSNRWIEGALIEKKRS